MELYIGGVAQGKLEYVKKIHPQEENLIVNKFHLWVRNEMEQGHDVLEALEKFINDNPKAIIISDEIGNGIVPMEDFEREYREIVGRALCQIAEKAERVERVICGLGQRLK